MLGAKDESLAKLASESIGKKHNNASGSSTASKKRPADESQNNKGKKRTKTTANKNSVLAEREERAMDLITTFVEDRGGSRDLLSSFRARVTTKKGGKFDTNYFNGEGRRFRSMLEVGRFLGLVNDGGSGTSVRKKGFGKKPVSREVEAEKKKLRKELEKLRKAHHRVVKNLDDFSENKESCYPIDDRFLIEEEDSPNALLSPGESAGPAVTLTTCAAARVPDIAGFPGIPEHCIPDVLMSWDFLCTFHRAISLTPIALDDFACALAYNPPEGVVGDGVHSPPVYIAESHLGLLKLLLQDRSSNDWWWSTIETDELINGAVELEEAEEEKGEDGPVIKVDMALLLAEVEDPLITTSWLRALEDVNNGKGKPGAVVKAAIKTALRVVSNKWVVAYLRKALEGYKTFGAEFTKKAVIWLIHQIREARPDLFNRSVSKEAVFEARAKVVEQVGKQMESLPVSTPTLKDEDAISDFEYDEDDDSDDSDDEEAAEISEKDQTSDAGKSQRPPSVIPPKPLPTYVDLLLPPAKPNHNSEFVNAFTWSQILGAVASRVLHRKKRLRNEVDDSLRAVHELRPLSLSDRRKREGLIASRVLTECADHLEGQHPLEKAIEHLCSGGNYLETSVVGRLCILRLIIEAAYDSERLHEVVSGNYKQRSSALKALDVEQRRAKREAKEKTAADERAAREELAAEGREKFLDEKREEIRKLNEKSHELSDEVLDSLTDEDILDFDEDIKADYEALPAPESFNKSEVRKMVERIQEETAFDTDALRVLTTDELLEREKVQLEEMEGELLRFGGPDALCDPSLDRETIRSIERLQKGIEKARILAEKLPEQRKKALEQLKDAMEDGTIKVLRGAIAAAKKAKLTGPDDETGGVWAVDLMRDAALELENAKQNKRVSDAQKDLIAKKNRCFIRTEPLGQDRFRNCFWSFSNSEAGYFWVETQYSLGKNGADLEKPPPGFLNLVKDAASITIGAQDMEEDTVGKHETDLDTFLLFCRREFHSTGFAPKLSKHHWGCQATEESLRAMIKNLDSRGIRESDLKKTLKEVMDERVGSEEKQNENTKDEQTPEDADDHVPGTGELESSRIQTSGDETAFEEARTRSRGDESVAQEILDKLTSGISQLVRVKIFLDDSKAARYEEGKVTGWTSRQESIEVVPENNDDLDKEHSEEPPEPTVKVVNVPTWRVLTDRGHVQWLDGPSLMQSLSRYDKWKNGRVGYLEDDAAFFAYRNNLGRHCGRAAEALYASSPISFARLMVKKESDLYAKLKIQYYDNNWGGKNGSRGAWTNSMKEYAFDFQTAKQGLITLENAFFELTGEFGLYKDKAKWEETPPDAKALLSDPLTRFDIELETIDKSVKGLWNSAATRAIFLEIVSSSTTTGTLCLALDLLCRNTFNYLQVHKLLSSRNYSASSSSIYDNNFEDAAPARRNTRRRNTWQQANEGFYYEE